MSKRTSDTLAVPSTGSHKTQRERSGTPDFSRSGHNTPGSGEGYFEDAFGTRGSSPGGSQNPLSEYGYDAGTVASGSGHSAEEQTAVTQGTSDSGGTANAGPKDELAYFSDLFGEASGAMPSLEPTSEQPSSSSDFKRHAEVRPNPYPPLSLSYQETRDLQVRSEAISRLLKKPGGSHLTCGPHKSRGSCPIAPKDRTPGCTTVEQQWSNIRYLDHLIAESKEPRSDLSIALLSDIDARFHANFNSANNERDINSSGLRLPEHLRQHMDRQKNKVVRYVESGGTCADASESLLKSIVGDSLVSRAKGNPI
ncbi:hypothetical protein IAU59_005117 [Kwoniella sp. CBS 9459]